MWCMMANAMIGFKIWASHTKFFFSGPEDLFPTLLSLLSVGKQFFRFGFCQFWSLSSTLRSR